MQLIYISVYSLINIKKKNHILFQIDSNIIDINISFSRISRSYKQLRELDSKLFFIGISNINFSPWPGKEFYFPFFFSSNKLRFNALVQHECIYMLYTGGYMKTIWKWKQKSTLSVKMVRKGRQIFYIPSIFVHQ